MGSLRRTILGIIISTGAILAAVVESTDKRYGYDFTWEAFALVIIALLPWMSEFITSLKFGSGNLEVQLREVERKANAAIDASLRGTGKQPPTIESGAAPKRAKTPEEDDPHKGKFGGESSVGGRNLSARIEKVPNESVFRRVVLKVESTDPAQNPLKGQVTFHLHPTFNVSVFDEPVIDGIAETSIISYGAFTVGAVADEGKTRLELDLTSLDDNKDQFFKR